MRKGKTYQVFMEDGHSFLIEYIGNHKDGNGEEWISGIASIYDEVDRVSRACPIFISAGKVLAKIPRQGTLQENMERAETLRKGRPRNHRRWKG